MRFFVFIFVTIVSSPAVSAAAADQVPAFNIERNCKLEAGTDSNAKQANARCKQDETNAKQQLSQRWSEFGAEPKRQCMTTSETGDDHSYVEVLTCLQMFTEWRQQPEPQTVGKGQPHRQPRR
jgi:hypothetical protein